MTVGRIVAGRDGGADGVGSGSGAPAADARRGAERADEFGDALLRIYDHVQKHADRDIPIGELAGIARLSESHFRTLFKKRTGRSPLAFVLSRRLKYAYVLIQAKGCSALDAAVAAGFNNYSSFAKLFKKEFGFTPREARKR